MDSTDESYLPQVMSPRTTTSWWLVSSPSQSPWPTHSSPSNGSSRMWITMTPRSRRCFITHTEYTSITPSEKACLSVSRCRPCPNTRGDPLWREQGDLLWQSGQELNVEHAQIRTLLDRQREQILAECQAEIKKHEVQANYDRRSVQQLSEIIESQQEELHCAQAEELQRRDQQLLHAYSKIRNYVKVTKKVSMKWKNWRSSRVPPSTLLQDED